VSPGGKALAEISKQDFGAADVWQVVFENEQNIH
jgi:hypothetical protein